MSGKDSELKTEVQKKLDSLCRLREDDFTKTIILPLFQGMGYDRVEFNGGPNERGRDLIAQKENPPLPDPKTVYVQAKKIENSSKAAGGVVFDKLCHQVRQCLHEPVKDIHGKEYRSDEVFVICPNQISSRFIDEIKHFFESADSKKIHLIDGVGVLKLIEKYKPELIDVLLNIEDKIVGSSGFAPGNIELLRAIKQSEEKDVEKLYNDLSFFVGSVDSNVLMHFDIKVLRRVVEVEEQGWLNFKKSLEYFMDRYDISICKDSILSIQDSFSNRLGEFESKENLALMAEAQELKASMAVARQGVDELSSLLLSRVDKLKSTKELSDVKVREIKAQIKEFSEGFDKSGPLDEKFSRDFKTLENYNKRISVADARLKEIGPIIKSRPKYIAECDFDKVRKFLRSQVERYFFWIDEINHRKVSKVQLKKFLIETEETLSFVNDLFSCENVRKFFDFVFSKEKQDRVSISAHDIFETGHDIAVYGSAGVGKTTTLEMYSKYCESSGGNVVYVPLNRVVDRLLKVKAATYDDPENSNHGFLKDLLIKAILLSRRIEPDRDKVESAKNFFSKGPTIILDGLDEAFNSISELIVAIKNHKIEYPKSQIIISSRDCVSYLNDIDFFGITLLPFTKGQLIDFIKRWFEPDAKKAESLIGQLSSEEALDALRTPLLATIACSLVERGVKAPSSESEVYSERLRLLLGDYDVHKGVTRQSNTSSRLLQIASVLALLMHEKRVRSLSLERMKEYLYEKLKGRFDIGLIDSCLSELIDPCCIIMLDPISQEYSFGHFRFQEHLVATAIRADRGVSIAEVTALDWWRGALCIYAQEGNISTIVEDVYNFNGNIKKSLITLNKMADNTPVSERKNVKLLIKMYAEQDEFENLILDDNNIGLSTMNLDSLGFDY